MTYSSDTIEIKFSKTKAILFTVASLIFVVISIWLLFNANNQTRYNPVTVYIGGFAGFILFGMFGVNWLRGIFQDKVGLIISKDGIFDDSGGLGKHLIKWDDIKSTRVESVKKTKFLLIYVNNPDNYIVGKSTFQKFWLNANYKMYDTPLSISVNSLDCNFDELNKTIQDSIIKYKQPEKTDT